MAKRRRRRSPPGDGGGGGGGGGGGPGGPGGPPGGGEGGGGGGGGGASLPEYRPESDYIANIRAKRRSLLLAGLRRMGRSAWWLNAPNYRSMLALIIGRSTGSGTGGFQLQDIRRR